MHGLKFGLHGAPVRLNMICADASGGVPKVTAVIHRAVDVTETHLPDHAVRPPLVAPYFAPYDGP